MSLLPSLRKLTAVLGLLMALPALAQTGGAVLDLILVDDQFENGRIATNPHGTGNGWNFGSFNGGSAPVEADGAFIGAMGTEQGISAIQGKDIFPVWDEAGTTITWTIRSMTVNTPHQFGYYFAYCWEMGVVSAKASNAGQAWNMSGPNKRGGFYVQIGKKDPWNRAEIWVTVTNKTNTGDHTSSGFYTPTQVSTSPGGIGPVFTVSFPVIVSATLTRHGWYVVTNQTGLEPLSGNWTTSLQTADKDARITDEFSNGVFVFTAARNHGIDGSGQSFPANTGQMERITVTRHSLHPIAVSTEIHPDSSSVDLTWASMPTHSYSIHHSTDLQAGFSIIQEGIPATPPFNTFHDDRPEAAGGFWRITKDP